MASEKPSITTELVNAREAALTTVRHVERLLYYMGLLKSRTQPGLLDTDNVLKSIELDAAQPHE